MPNRWIKEAYCSSERIEAVSPAARDCWVRILVNADDHGRFDGRAQIVASRCYPLNPNAIKCEQLMAELAKSDLIRFYEHENRRYLIVTRWYERARSASKYPQPPADVFNCEQVQAIARSHVHDHDHDHEARNKRGPASKSAIPDGWKPKPQTVERLSREFGLRVPEDVDRYVAAFHDACHAKGYQYRDFDAAFANCVRQDWPKLRDRSGKVVSIAGEKRMVV